MWQKLRQWMTMSDDTANKPFPWADQWPEITDERVRGAFARVERTGFIAPDLARFAGQDAPLPIGEGQTISQPFVVALMVQMLALRPGARVLEIGTGSGYQTAILCEMTHAADEPAGATVYSIERYPSLADRAAQVLPHMGTCRTCAWATAQPGGRKLRPLTRSSSPQRPPTCPGRCASNWPTAGAWCSR